jgi:hypothetical protein
MGLTRSVAWRCRYRIGVPQASAGAWVLLGGVDASIVKTATIVDAAAAGGDLEAYICRPLRFDNAAVVKVSAPAVAPSPVRATNRQYCCCLGARFLIWLRTLGLVAVRRSHPIPCLVAVSVSVPDCD